jgi:hypothetical protein
MHEHTITLGDDEALVLSSCCLSSGEIMKPFIVAISLLASMPVLASVNCAGVPTATKVGEFGAQESYLIVTINNLDFRLGLVDDQGAKARFAIATAALAADKALLLRFFDPYSDCTSASTNKAIPSSTQILQ